MAIVEKAKEAFFEMVESFGSDPYVILPHVPEVEAWVKHLVKRHPEADEEIALLGAWLHDLGHYPIPTEIDHAVRSEQRARAFLEREGYPADRMERVLHCVRAHRCKDVMPATIEAKIVACADSASHMTQEMYFDMARDDKIEKKPLRVYAKMERDYRDIGIFPEVQQELTPLFEAWKKVVEAYEKLDLEISSPKR